MNVMSERIGYFKIKQRQHVVSLPCPHAKANSLVRFTNALPYDPVILLSFELFKRTQKLPSDLFESF